MIVRSRALPGRRGSGVTPSRDAATRTALLVFGLVTVGITGFACGGGGDGEAANQGTPPATGGTGAASGASGAGGTAGAPSEAGSGGISAAGQAGVAGAAGAVGGSGSSGASGTASSGFSLRTGGFGVVPPGGTDAFRVRLGGLSTLPVACSDKFCVTGDLR